MKTVIKLLACLLALLLLALPLASCSEKPGDEETTPGGGDPVPTPDTDLPIRIQLLNGTTALGAAALIASDNEMSYEIEIQTAADKVTGTIVSGEADIAALPTNVAAKLYKANPDKIRLLAVNTLGVLYLLANGETVTDISSLANKTVYVPGAGSNPEYITKALVDAYGVANVTVDATSYPSPDELATAVASGNAKLAVLPEPKVTVVCTKNASVSVALDMTAAWEEKYGENTLAQGCLVVNKAFADAHPVELSRFLDDYKRSVETVKSMSDEAIAMIVDAKLLPSAGVAQNALPNCNLCFIEGEAMKTAMKVCYEKFYEADPKSILAVPDDAFYYVR